MSSFFGGGFNTLHTPLMAHGDEGPVEETKEADLGLVDIGHGGEMANSHGDLGRGGVARAITQSQCDDADTTQDWD